MPLPTSNNRLTIPLTLGGSYSAGDPASIPDGHTRFASNVLIRPNRIDSRPPAVYDNLSSIIGLGDWDDQVNRFRRFFALDSTKIYKKATSGETWDAGTSGSAFGTRFTSFANLLGKLYLLFDNGSGTPSAATYYDGTTMAVAPWILLSGTESAIYAKSTAAFDNRLYLADPLAVIKNDIFGHAYDQTTGWIISDSSVKNITTNSGQVICQAYIQSGGFGEMRPDTANYSISIPASSVPVQGVLRWDMQATDALLSQHITLVMSLYGAWAQNHNYGVGDLVTSSTPNLPHTISLQRCTTAGTSGGGGQPAFSTTVGNTTNDNTVVWTNVGYADMAVLDSSIPSISDATNWTTFVLPFTVPPRTNAVSIYPSLYWFTNTVSGSGTFTAVATPASNIINLSLKDGKSDSDPSKQNYGLQITVGNYTYPFFNQESSGTATKNLADLIWTEINDPSTIRANNTYNPQEEAGDPTAVIAAGQRLVLFKRYAYWVMAPTADPDTPILPETSRVGIGCIGPQALGTLDDEIFFIADREIYRMKIGYEPRPIGGEAMREEIMDHGSNWVESQSTYKMPLLAVDERNREIWVYTQKGKLYVYHIGDEATPAVFRPYTPEKGQWTTIDIQGKEVHAMAYNQNTGEMYISLGGFGLVRLDPSSAAKDIIDNTATQYSVTPTFILKPIEQFAPRYDALVEEIALYHTATASQSGQTLTAYISTDRGATYPHQITATFDQTVPRIRIPIWQFGPSITLKLVYSGQTGSQVFGASRAEATLNIKRGEYPQSNPALSGANL